MKSLAIILSVLMTIGLMALPAMAAGPMQPQQATHMSGNTMGHEFAHNGNQDIEGLQAQVAKKLAEIKTLKAQPKPDWSRIDALTLEVNQLQSQIQTQENLRGLSEPDFFYGCYASRAGYRCP